MTSDKIPLELEQITQYVHLAEELIHDETNPDSRLVAYYCRQYAVQLGTPLVTGPDGQATLATIVDAIDNDKNKIEKNTKKEAYMTCRSLAMEMFDKADAEDRAGETGNETANKFYMAGSILDVLKHFTEEGGRGEEASIEEEKKSFYAKRRTASISKAIKEGQELTPRSYTDADTGSVAGGDDEGGEEEGQDFPKINGMPLQSMQEEVGPGGQGFETTPTRVERQRSVRKNDRCLGRAATFDRAPTAHPSIQSVNSMPGNTRSPKSKKPPTFGKMFRSPPLIFPMSSNPTSSGNVSKEDMKKAKELTKFATKALEMKDVDVAVKRLKEALETLGQWESDIHIHIYTNMIQSTNIVLLPIREEAVSNKIR